MKWGCLFAAVVVFLTFAITAPLTAVVVRYNNSESGTTPTPGNPSTPTPVTATTWQMPKGVLNKIVAKKDAYVKAAEKGRIPWQLLAAINYRECSLSDCAPSGEEMGEVSPDTGTIRCPVSAGYASCLDLFTTILRDNSKDFYKIELSPTSSQEDLIKAMVAYNRGGMYVEGGCSVDDCPYAWNQFDDAHKDMRWPDNDCEPSGTRGTINIPAGGFTIYSYLVTNNI